MFKDHETKWNECRECLGEIIPAAEFLWSQDEIPRQRGLSYLGYSCAQRIGELDAALRIVQHEETFWASHAGRVARKGLLCSYGNQAAILQVWGRLDEAFALHKKEEAISLELGDKNGLQISYGNQALILMTWGRMDEALALLKNQERICLERRDKDSLQGSYGNQANILKDWGRLDDALALHKKEEAICLELGNKDSLQRSYGNQADILRVLGRLDEALGLLKKQEAICLELGSKSSLGYCYWTWGLLARALLDPATEKQKIEAALAIFTALRMPREREEVQADLNKSRAAEA